VDVSSGEEPPHQKDSASEVPEDVEVVTVHVFIMLGKYFVSVKYVFVCIKLMCVYVKLLKI
jgi:hypothetical protein